MIFVERIFCQNTEKTNQKKKIITPTAPLKNRDGDRHPLLPPKGAGVHVRTKRNFLQNA